MKSLSLLFILGLYLSCFTYVYTIKCFICDPDVETDCIDFPVDCEDDKDLGDAFDSCYTNEVLAQDKNGTVYTQTFKYCGIKDGCQQMTDMRCEEVNKTYANLVNIECRGYCCDEHEYCNSYPVPTAGTTEQSRTEATKPDLNVQGYKSNAQLKLLPSSIALLVCWLLTLLEL